MENQTINEWLRDQKATNETFQPRPATTRQTGPVNFFKAKAISSKPALLRSLDRAINQLATK